MSELNRDQQLSEEDEQFARISSQVASKEGAIIPDAEVEQEREQDHGYIDVQAEAQDAGESQRELEYEQVYEDAPELAAQNAYQSPTNQSQQNLAESHGEEYGTAGNSRQRIIDHNIERLQQINLKLRNRIKDLNTVVEKALERQSTKIAAKNANLNFDADHMLRIREKEIQNSKKQIETNKNVIDKLHEKLRGLGPSGTTDADGNPISWETKYQQQLDLKARLEKSIKQLEKQNSLQGSAIEKATNSEDQAVKLKALSEDLRVWKQKVASLATQLERDRETRREQDNKLKSIQEENIRVQDQISRVESKLAANGPSPEQRKLIEERNQAEQRAVEEQENQKAQQDSKFREFKKKERAQQVQIKELTEQLNQLKQQLKEKEQLNRISSYKLNDLKRSIKHNSLKPLGAPRVEGEGSIISGHSPGPSSVNDEAPGRNKNSQIYRRNTSRKQLIPISNNRSIANTRSVKGSSSLASADKIGEGDSRFSVKKSKQSQQSPSQKLPPTIQSKQTLMQDSVQPNIGMQSEDSAQGADLDRMLTNQVNAQPNITIDHRENNSQIRAQAQDIEDTYSDNYD